MGGDGAHTVDPVLRRHGREAGGFEHLREDAADLRVVLDDDGGTEFVGRGVHAVLPQDVPCVEIRPQLRYPMCK